MNWKTLEIGEIVEWHYKDFDGEGSYIGVVTDIDKNRALVVADGMTLWLDDNTKEMFRKTPKYNVRVTNRI